VTRYIEGMAIRYLGVSTEVLDEIGIDRFICELPVFFSFVVFDGLSFRSSGISQACILSILSNMLVGAIPGICG
jgi:hypothetical protein